MRYYNLTTTPSTASDGVLQTVSGLIPLGSSGTGVAQQWTSFPGGKYDPNALDIVFDLQIAPGHIPSGATVISVHGVDKKSLYHSQDYANSTIMLQAGMRDGLPLSANQPAPGLLIQGMVQGAFGNWQGTEQSLDFLVVPSGYTQQLPGNLVFNWQPGQSFSAAITATLARAYPQSKVTIAVSPDLVNTSGQPIINANRTFNSLATFIQAHTEGKFGKSYLGVFMYHAGSRITVTDFSQPVGSSTVAIKFTDLIGQPTWLEAPTLTISTILRADIQVGSYITLPEVKQIGPGLVTLGRTQATANFPRNELTFKGTFVVTALRAVGEFRGTDENSWTTIIQAVPQEFYSTGAS